MFRRVTFGLFLSMGVCLSLAIPAAERAISKSALESDPTGWEDLLPGKDLKGWRRVVLPPDEKLNTKNAWSVDEKNKLLVCNGVGVKEMFLHEKERGDGIFHVEWRFKKVEEKPAYNSGVYVRSALDGKVWHQVQVAHQKERPQLGDIFGDSPVDGKVKRIQIAGDANQFAKPPGEWNTYEVTCAGKNVRVWVNGYVTTIWNDCPVPKGHVGLQAEFYDIEFRNLNFKPLK